VAIQQQRLGRPFWRLWWASGISGSGDGLVAVALPLLTVTMTRNPLLIAGVTAVYKASAAVTSLPAGVLADRVDRRLMMMGCNLVAGAALVLLVVAMLLGVMDLAMVYLVAVVLAVCGVAYTLAMQACFPDVVSSPELLTEANGRLIAVQGAGEQFLGPGSGGVLFALSRKLPFFLDSVSFFVAAWLVKIAIPPARSRGLHAAPALLRVPAGDDRPAAPGLHWRRRPSLTSDLADGWRLFRRQPALKLLAAVVASVSFTQSIVFGLLVLYGTRTLHLGSSGYGLFLAFASSFGVAGAFSAGRLQRRFGTARLIVGGCALAAVSYLGMAFTHVAVLAVFMFGLQEIGVAVSNVGSVTVRQRLIPRKVYGRVASIHRLIVTGAAPVGAVLGGVIASVSSVPTALLVAGALETVMLVLLAPLLMRALAAERNLVPVPSG